MFWNEDDIQPTVNTAIEIFGTQAQYQPEPFVFVSIETPKFGPIWYGDISGDYTTVKEKVTQLAGKLGETVTARDMGTSAVIITV